MTTTQEQPHQITECPECNGSIPLTRCLADDAHCECCDDTGRVFVGLIHGERYPAVFSPSDWRWAMKTGILFDPLPETWKPSRWLLWLVALVGSPVERLNRLVERLRNYAYYGPSIHGDDDGAPF